MRAGARRDRRPRARPGARFTRPPRRSCRAAQGPVQLTRSSGCARAALRDLRPVADRGAALDQMVDAAGARSSRGRLHLLAAHQRTQLLEEPSDRAARPRVPRRQPAQVPRARPVRRRGASGGGRVERSGSSARGSRPWPARAAARGCAGRRDGEQSVPGRRQRAEARRQRGVRRVRQPPHDAVVAAQVPRGRAAGPWPSRRPRPPGGRCARSAPARARGRAGGRRGERVRGGRTDRARALTFAGRPAPGRRRPAAPAAAGTRGPRRPGSSTTSPVSTTPLLSTWSMQVAERRLGGAGQSCGVVATCASSPPGPQEVVRRPGAGEHQVHALARQRTRAPARPSRRRSAVFGAVHQQHRVEQQAAGLGRQLLAHVRGAPAFAASSGPGAARARSPRPFAARELRARAPCAAGTRGRSAPSRRDAWRAPRRPRRRSRMPHSARPRSRSRRRVTRRTSPRDVGDRRLVAREQREQLHGQQRALAQEVLGDALVAQRACGDPVEVPEPALDRLGAVARERRRRRQQPQAVGDRQGAQRAQPGQPGRRALDGRDASCARAGRTRTSRSRSPS